MARRPRGRLVLVTVAAATLLAGCSNESPVPVVAAPAATAQSSPGIPTSTPATRPGRSTGAVQPKPFPDSRTQRADPAGDADADADADADQDEDEAGGSAPSPGVEVPPAAQPSVDSLSDLLEAIDTRPLVRTPLPPPATAVSRLVRAFPAILRPTRSSWVESSSISPEGDRLQVGLVGSTSLSPAEVLLAFRTRLPRRGLAEQAAPVTATDAQAAAFRRGRSVVTISVSAHGNRTTYAVHASLHTGRE